MMTSLHAGSEEDVKKAGKFHVMGKDYIVEDGDIVISDLMFKN